MTDNASLAALKPCPFCGESGAMFCDSPCGWHNSEKAWAVSCRTKGCHGAIFSLGYDLFETQAEAAAAWNTRTADQRCAELEAENARLREALAKDATRFEVCAGMIEQSFNASGTLRAERTMKAKHFALEALTALENRDD